jgi:predicted MPP superfamily phosphohydrolase
MDGARTPRDLSGRTRRAAARSGRRLVAAARRLGARPTGRPASARRLTARRLAGWLATALVATAGLAGAVLLAGQVDQSVGPFQAHFAMTPSLHGGTEVDIPPLGSLRLRDHAGPAHLRVRLDSLDAVRTRQLVLDPHGIDNASQHAVADAARGVDRLILRVAGVGILGAMLLGAVVFRDVRRVAACGVLAVAILAASGATAASTFRADAVAEPEYQGLLANAPAVVGDARRIAGQFDAYRAQLQRLVNNVSRLYATFSTLPVYEPDQDTVRVLHVSDMHLNPAAWSVVQTVVEQFHIDVVVDTGDINDWGTPMESSYVDSIGRLGVPYVYIRGNHDSAVTARAVAGERNAIVLDGNRVTVHGLTIAGIGDPRFTPDKSGEAAGSDRRQTLTRVYESGEKLAAVVRDSPVPVDIAMVHDPLSAGPLAGSCPLVLAGHTHRRSVATLGGAGAPDATMLMVEGSTGGAGLRGLEGEQPTPLELSVLYLDGSDHRIKAYDDITVDGTGQAGVNLQRHVVRPENPPAGAPTPQR